jgi:hypothetical protein
MIFPLSSMGKVKKTYFQRPYFSERVMAINSKFDLIDSAKVNRSVNLLFMDPNLLHLSINRKQFTSSSYATFSVNRFQAIHQ